MAFEKNNVAYFIYLFHSHPSDIDIADKKFLSPGCEAGRDTVEFSWIIAISKERCERKQWRIISGSSRATEQRSWSALRKTINRKNTFLNRCCSGFNKSFAWSQLKVDVSALLERTDVQFPVSIGSPLRRSQEWRFCCYNQLMLRLRTRSHRRTVDGTLTLPSSTLCLRIQVPSAYRAGVGRTFDRVTTHRPCFFAPVAPQDVSSPPHIIVFQGMMLPASQALLFFPTQATHRICR